MALKDVLENLGITPESVAKSNNIGADLRDDFLRRNGRGGVAASAPVSVGNGLGGGQFGFLNFDNPTAAPEKKDDGFWSSGIGGFLADVIDVVDTPRAAVVAAGKQLGKALDPNEDASWDEWWSDTSRNMTFQEVLDDVGMAGGWQRSTLGFLGDALSDPLTYVGAGAVARGGRTAAKEATELGLEYAAKQGGRETLSKALAERAVALGLEGDEAVQALTAQAARRGRGAITKQGLKRAGVSAELADALGVPELTKTFAGRAIPGTKAWAEIVENGKGALKSALGDTAAADVYRGLRITEAGGRKELLNIARRAADPEKGFKAVASSVASQVGKREGYAWTDLMSRKAREAFGVEFRKMDDAAAAKFVHEVEQGVQGGLHDKYRQFMAEVRQDLVDRGVDIGDLQNYVPHRLTDEARASMNPEVRKFVSGLDGASFFENTRTLVPGSKFLGVELKDASIAEINNIAEDVLGFKVLKDDVRSLMADYLGQGGQTVMRKNVEQTLEKFGVAVQNKAIHSLDDAQQAALDAADAAAAALRKEQDVLLSNGVKVRLGDESKAMSAALKRERKVLAGRIHKLRIKLADTARAQYDLTQRAAVLESQIDVVVENIQVLKKVASGQRAEARRLSLQKIADLEKELATMQAQHSAAKSQLAAFLKKRPTGARGAAARRSVDNMNAELQAARDRLAGVVADDVELGRAHAILDADAAIPSGAPASGSDGWLDDFLDGPPRGNNVDDSDVWGVAARPRAVGSPEQQANWRKLMGAEADTPDAWVRAGGDFAPQGKMDQFPLDALDDAAGAANGAARAAATPPPAGLSGKALRDADKVSAETAAKALGDSPALNAPSEWALKAERETVDWLEKQVEKDATKLTDLTWTALEDQKLLAWMEKAQAEFDSAYKGLQKTRKKNRGASDYKAIRDNIEQVRNMMASPEYESMFGPELAYIRNFEASAAIWDMQAWRKGVKASNFEDAARAMRAPGFGAKIQYDMERGIRALTKDGRLGVPDWVADAMEIQGVIGDPKFWPGASQFAKNLENLWKGWAVGRPGFLVRNAYSSGFGIYLEAGSKAVTSVAQFKKFFKMYRADPTGYMETATARWGADLASKMDDAMKVVNATGGGLAASEFHTGFLHSASWKPWSADFGYIKGIRSANEVVEGVLRGGHALDVMKRGGSVGSAIDVIEKYHFNYRDITRLDRGMKHAAPFWTFFVNNVALQAHVWTHDLPKLNRTYFNLQRNMGYGDPNEKGQPEWMERNMGLPLSVNPDGNSQYLNLGLPSIDFVRDVSSAVDRPASLLSQTAPWVQMPLEALAGKNFFTGRSTDGVRDAGLWGVIPGLGEDTGSGGKAISGFQADLLNSLLPGVSNANRISDGGNGLDLPKLFSWFSGVGVSELTPKMRSQNVYSQLLAEREAEKRRQKLQGM